MLSAQALHQILDGQHRKQRQRAHNDQQDQPPGRGHRVWGWCHGPDPGPRRSAPRSCPGCPANRPRTPPPACPGAAARQKTPASHATPAWPSKCSAMARWPELEMGRNSARPWIRPSRMDDSKDNGFTSSSHSKSDIHDISISRPGGKFQSYFRGKPTAQKQTGPCDRSALLDSASGSHLVQRLQGGSGRRLLRLFFAVAGAACPPAAPLSSTSAWKVLSWSGPCLADHAGR